MKYDQLNPGDSAWANTLYAEVSKKLSDYAAGDVKRLHLLRRRVFKKLM